jgi:hypothetical protein
LQKELTNWFLLTKAGYDTRLTYLGDYVFVYVHSNENLFETLLIEVDGKTFVNLSKIHREIETNGIYLNMHSLEPNENGKPFSFELKQLMRIKVQVIPKLPPDRMGFGTTSVSQAGTLNVTKASIL